MAKKTALAVLAVFLTWSVLDFIIHGVVLSSAYASTPQLWRPMNEMKTGVLYFTVLIAAAAFVYIYARFVSDKSMRNAVMYGLIFGIGSGVSMGYGSYAVMPIPYTIAFGWFLGSLVEAVAAGLVTGLIIKR